MSGRARIFVAVMNHFVVIREDPFLSKEDEQEPNFYEETFDDETSTQDNIVWTSCQAALRIAQQYKSCKIFIDEKQFQEIRHHFSKKEQAMFRPVAPSEFPKRLRKIFLLTNIQHCILKDVVVKLFGQQRKRKRHYF